MCDGDPETLTGSLQLALARNGAFAQTLQTYPDVNLV